MKVLFLNYEYPPLGGGAANATAALLEEWRHQSDIEVHLVTSGIGNIFKQEILGNNIHISYLSIGKSELNLHHQSLKDLLFYSIKGWWFARRLLRQEKIPFDTTLAFFGVPCGFIAMLLKWEFGLPYVVSLRGSDVPGYSQKYAWMYPLLRPLVKAVWKRAKAVVPNSQGLLKLALATSPNQAFTIIENGVDTRRFFTDPVKRPEHAFIVTSGASRVTERKGLNYLVEAVAMLVPKYPELQLKIMGDGSARPALEALVKERGIEDKVWFLGRISREATAPYYQEASLFVLPSLNEGMSNAMLEALASGLPLVSTPTGGATELVIEGKNGLTIKEKSAQSIAAAIEKFLINKNLVAEYGAESRARAEAQGWDRVAHQFQTILGRDTSGS